MGRHGTLLGLGLSRAGLTPKKAHMSCLGRHLGTKPVRVRHGEPVGLSVPCLDGPCLTWTCGGPCRVARMLIYMSDVVAASRDGAGSAVDTSGSGMVTFDTSEVSDLVYLHAALCESLRFSRSRLRSSPTCCRVGRS
jgi:hypothetical protein